MIYGEGKWREVLLLALSFMTIAVLADKKKGKPIEPVYTLPEPDPLPAVPLPDRPLSAIREMRPPIRHTVAQQQGIDVSHHQGIINWEQVAMDESITFVYIKATEGANFVDELYLRNLHGARRAGIPVGSYHFFLPSVSPLLQLENFRMMVDPRQQDLIPVIDVEKPCKGSISQFQRNLKTFLDGVERMFGVKPIIYTGVNYYAKYLEGHFTGYRFMVARYAEEFPGLSEDVPIVLWQYSESSYVDGIRGHVDKSVFLDKYSVADIMLKTP